MASIVGGPAVGAAWTAVARAVGADGLGSRHGPARPVPERRRRCGRSPTRSSGWVDRLGAVWVEGQIAQVSRRPGSNTVFLTLRDPSPTSRCRSPARGRSSTRLDPPLVEGASVVVHAEAVVLRQPRHAVARRPTRSGWSASASCWPGSSGAASCSPPRACSRAERKRPLPFLPGRVGLVTGASSAAERDVARERPAPLAGGRLRGRVRRHAGPARPPAR